MMDLTPILDYLTQLEAHNDPAWYHAHKPEYQAAKADFEALVGQLNLELSARDPALPIWEPASLTFKLNRDTRFSKDKSPYNPSFRAHIGPKGKLPIPVGYYLMVRPGGRSFLGGGLFADMFQNATTMIRDHIAAHGARWADLLAAPSFAQAFTLGGTALKNVPKGYDPDHPQGEHLKYKSWYIEDPVPDALLLEGDFLTYATERFLAMKPFNDFLNEALEGFQMPTR